MAAATLIQPPLPFIRYQVSRVAVYLLHLANAADYLDKRAWFYPFKDRFLLKHGLFDGYDVQTIERECWTCEGSGIYGENDWHVIYCNRCNATGIYRTDHVALQRWLINGSLFHIPRREINFELVTVRESISGIITHRPVHPLVGELAFWILLARYEPSTLWEILSYRVKAWLKSTCNPLWGRFGFLRKFIRDAITDASPSAAIETDDIPF